MVWMKGLSDGVDEGPSGGVNDSVNEGPCDGVDERPSDGVDEGPSDGVDEGPSDGVDEGPSDGPSDAILHVTIKSSRILKAYEIEYYLMGLESDVKRQLSLLLTSLNKQIVWPETRKIRLQEETAYRDRVQ
ncbi:hypothetical protein EMCRGX_G004610 [Ephydatia muelleri]